MSLKKLSKTTILFTAAIALALASCSSSKSASNNIATIDANKWKLVSMNGTADSAYTEGDSFTIEFIKEKKTIAGVAACNRFFGTYELSDNETVKINTGGSTMMACPNMNLEQPFFLMLESVTKYAITDSILDLYNGDNKVASFTPFQVDMHNAANSLDIVGEYFGNLIAADCPGINTTIILQNDNTYTIDMEYIDREVKVSEKGKYEVAENILTLIPDSGVAQKYKIGENKLFCLDGDGNIVEGELADRFILLKK